MESIRHEIFQELVSLGFKGPGLVKQFQIERTNIRKAAQRMIAEADEIAKGTVQGTTFADIFDSED